MGVSVQGEALDACMAALPLSGPLSKITDTWTFTRCRLTSS
jgi:hypothetical protein